MTMRLDDALRSTHRGPSSLHAAPAVVSAFVVEGVPGVGRSVTSDRIDGEVARSRPVLARVVVEQVAPLQHVDARLRAEFAALATAPTTAGVLPSTTAHDVVVPRACRGPSPHGYGESPAAPRTRDGVYRAMVLSEGAIASLRERVRAVAADDLVRAHCPHAARAGDDVDAVAAAIVVDVFAVCPDVLASPELAPYACAASTGHTPSSGPSSVSDAFDLASLFAPLAQNAGMGLQALGGLLTNPVVVGMLAPLLGAALSAALPGVGFLVAPLLPVLLPLVGQQLAAVGSSVAGGGGSPFDVAGVAAGFAGAV